MPTLIPGENNLCDCPKTGAWLTRGGAKLRLKKIRTKNKGSRRKTPQRVYQCEQGVYHLTSKERHDGNSNG